MDVAQVIRRKLINGLEAAVAYEASSLGEKLRQNAVDEAGRRSEPGEYPFLDTGKLVQHVAYEVDRTELAAGSGVKEAAGGKQPAEYFLNLELDMGRLGQVHSFMEDVPQIIAAFELGASR